MKRILAAGLLAGALLLASCGPEEVVTTSSSSSEPPVSEKIQKTRIVTYEGPSIMHTSEQVAIEVEGQELFVYETRVNDGRTFSWSNDYRMSPYSYFDFEGRAHVSMTFPEAVESASVSPLAYGIEPTIEGNVVSFDLEQPNNYVIEINGDPKTAVQLFANPLEEDVPEEGDEGVVYIGPGVYDAGAIPLEEGDTLYLSGGAYVFGNIRTELLDDITIRGRGVLSGETYSRDGEGDNTCPIEFRAGKNLRIEGIILADPAGWAVTLYNCDHVTMENVKIITARPNGDGISVQGSRDVEVTGGYVRTWDDSLVVKDNDGHSSERVSFSQVNVWTDLAQSMEVGYEANGDVMRDISFRDITVVHNYHKAVVSLHNADRAQVSNVLYENITVEHGEMLGDNRNDGMNDYLIDLSIEYNADWSVNEDLGDVDGVTVRNVLFQDVPDTAITRVRGDLATGAVMRNVTFENIQIGDVEAKDASSLRLQEGSNVENVTIKGGTATGANLPYPYDLSELGDEVEKTHVEGIDQEAVLVPDFAVLKGDLQYLGTPIDYEVTSATLTHGTGKLFNDPADDGSGSYEDPNAPISNLFDGDQGTVFTSLAYDQDEEDEFLALTIEFAEPVYVGNIRLMGSADNDYSYQYQINTRARREGDPGFRNAQNLTTYALSPKQGNAIEIAISAMTVEALQFRIYMVEDEYFQIDRLSFGSLELYGPSLSYNKSIVDSTPYSDVYTPNRLTDGDPNGTSYYESDGFPAHIVLDLGTVYEVRVIALNLPNSLMWNARTQRIAFSGSAQDIPYGNDVKFDTFLEEQDYLFDPQQGNKVTIELAEPVRMRYLRLDISANDIAGGYGAQLSEIYVFGSN